jgi:N-acetylmuramoyl-L-alanine amidase
MASERMKRRLLREAITENIDLIEGRRPSRRRGRRRSPLPATLALALPVLGLASLGLSGVEIENLFADQGMSGFSAWKIPQTVTMGAAEDRVIHHSVPTTLDPTVFPLTVERIVIDPGHGGEAAGTQTPNGLMEKEIVLDIGLRLRDLLLEHGYQVSMTRTDDRDVSLEERVRFANQVEGDLFLSIHINWIETRHTRGVETYYLGPTEDPYLEQLARAENQNSGYSLADFRRLLQGVYETVRGDESRQLAQDVQLSIYRALRQVNPKLENRGVKTAPFVVLIGTQMPAILAEVSCLSNEEEAELLAKPHYRQYIAEALAAGLGRYADSLELEDDSEQVAEAEARTPLVAANGF